MLITSEGVTTNEVVLNLAEVELFDANGVKLAGSALRASQSSLWPSDFGFYEWAENAIDGACVAVAKAYGVRRF